MFQVVSVINMLIVFDIDLHSIFLIFISAAAAPYVYITLFLYKLVQAHTLCIKGTASHDSKVAWFIYLNFDQLL